MEYSYTSLLYIVSSCGMPLERILVYFRYASSQGMNQSRSIDLICTHTLCEEVAFVQFFIRSFVRSWDFRKGLPVFFDSDAFRWYSLQCHTCVDSSITSTTGPWLGEGQCCQRYLPFHAIACTLERLWEQYLVSLRYASSRGMIQSRSKERLEAVQKTAQSPFMWGAC